jgi:hypothetical protein
LPDKRKLEGIALSISLILISLDLILFGAAGILSIPKLPANCTFEGTQLVRPNDAPIDLLLGHAIKLDPNIAMVVSLAVRSQENYPFARGTLRIRLDRYGVSLQPYFTEKEIQAAVMMNQTFEFYSLEENYFELIMYETEGSDPVYVDWHVEIVSLDFGLATFSFLFIMAGLFILIEVIHFLPFLLSRRLKVARHSIVVFVILLAVLILPAHDLARLLYYFSLTLKPLPDILILRFTGNFAIFIFPLLIFLITPKIVKRRYKLKELEDGHIIVKLLRQRFGELHVYQFQSEKIEAYLIDVTTHGPEIGMSTDLIKEFENGNLDQDDVINIASHEVSHAINLDFIFLNFSRILLDKYKYWLLLYVANFWFLQLVRVNPYGWVAPIVYILSPEFLTELYAGIQFLLRGDFAAAKIILPFLDINITGTFFIILIFSFLMPYFLLSLTLREGELIADKLACLHFTSKEGMIKTIKKFSLVRILRKIKLASFREASVSERIKNLLEMRSLTIDFYPTIRDSLAIGILSFNFFMCFNHPFLTLFLIPLLGISFIRLVYNYNYFTTECSLDKITFNLKKVGLESFLSGLTNIIIPLLLSFTEERYREPSFLIAGLAISLVYLPLASSIPSMLLFLALHIERRLFQK